MQFIKYLLFWAELNNLDQILSIHPLERSEFALKHK